jgi:pimeloyl-ACP methyl ester carboxylesterase
MDRSAGMARVIGHLRDLHVVRYDRRGYGRSWAAGTTDLAGHAEDLITVLAGRPAVVVGHSMGGAVALAAAARRPDLVRGVGAYESPLPEPGSAPEPGDDEAAKDQRVAERFLRRMIGDQAWESLAPGIQEARRREGPALVADGRALRASPPAFDPTAVTVPVVAGTGSDSPERFGRYAERIAVATKGELLVLEGADHGVHLRHPALFAEFVRQVLRVAGWWPVEAAGVPSDRLPGMSDRPVNLSTSGPPETVLDLEPAEALIGLQQALAAEAGQRRAAVAAVVARFPRFLDGWARLGQLAGDDIEAYASYRVGYHRGLDRLRANGWRGSGYVRWQHETNRGFLRSLHGLHQQAAAIGEQDEADRCEQFLHMLDPDWPPTDLD